MRQTAILKPHLNKLYFIYLFIFCFLVHFVLVLGFSSRVKNKNHLNNFGYAIICICGSQFQKFAKWMNFQNKTRELSSENVCQLKRVYFKMNFSFRTLPKNIFLFFVELIKVQIIYDCVCLALGNFRQFCKTLKAASIVWNLFV